MPDPADPLDDLDEEDETDDELDDDPGRRRASVSPSDVDRRIATALRDLADRNRYSYRTLAGAITPADPDETWNKSRLQRLLTATRRFTITELLDILRTLDEPPKRFLAKVGVITAADDLRSRVENDVWLDPGTRKAVLALIDDAYQRAGKSAERDTPHPN